MKVHELGLCAESDYRLARLAMAVEVHCKQRFSTRKDVMDVAAMLVVAETSEHELVMQRREEFLQSLQPAARKLMGSLTGEQDGSQVRISDGVIGQIPVGALYRGKPLTEELLDGIYATNDPRGTRLYRGRMAS